MRLLCPSSLVAVLLLVTLGRTPDEPLAPPPSPRAATPSCADEPAQVDPRLVGLWHRFDALHEGDPVRFYFFHAQGFGIYRYGKVGLTNTHSFDYDADAGALSLRFRKTGAAHAPRYAFEDGGATLVLRGDPREDAAEVRYRRAPDLTAALCQGGLLDARARAGEGPAAAGALGGRLWGDEQRFATGGLGFSIYQFQPQAIDGRGVGWHHRGDYDEWTTETLTYRQQGDRLALAFTLRHDGAVTDIAVAAAPDGARTLTLAEDPRDFWRPHAYRDMGPSFALACP
jgi:hypothetical protein